MVIRALISVVIMLVCALDVWAAPGGAAGRFFVQGREAEAIDVTLSRFGGRRMRVFDRQVAYRNDRKACVTFELPAELPLPGTPLHLELEAYNDDRQYLRAIWFEVDGIGGYLAVQRVADGQYRGSGTIAPGEQKRWILPLDSLPIAKDGKTATVVNLDAVLRQPGLHTICTWLSTYARYGPESWITLDLVGSLETDFSGMQATGDKAIFATGPKTSQRSSAGGDPCAGRSLLLPDRSLRLTLKRHPDPDGAFYQPVCAVLEVSSTRGGKDALLQHLDLIQGEAKGPGFYLDYHFSDYLVHTGLVILKRAKALRLYDATARTLSPLIAARQCIGEDGRSFNINRLQALDKGRFLYGEALSCRPFLVQSDQPLKPFSFLETIDPYTLFRGDAGLLLAADPDSAVLYRFSPRPGRDDRFSLTYFLNDRGMAAYRRKDYLQAVKWFDRAAKITPQDYLFPHTNLAGSLALAGRKVEALSRLHHACTLDRSFTRTRMLKDADFDGLRDSARFQKILQGVCGEN